MAQLASIPGEDLLRRLALDAGGWAVGQRGPVLHA